MKKKTQYCACILEGSGRGGAEGDNRPPLPGIVIPSHWLSGTAPIPARFAEIIMKRRIYRRYITF